MPRESRPEISETDKPMAFGTGLVALDVIVNVNSEEESPAFFAGGTCGNVLAILSHLGWNSSPISRLRSGPAADRGLADLKLMGVRTKFVSTADDGSTPIIIQRIGRRPTGEPYHTFSWRCPACGTHLPGYKPVLATVAQQLAEMLPRAQVFFFDRVTRGALHLAKNFADQGAVVVFEPSGFGDPTLFREAWSLAHVVKYSHERLRDIADLDWKGSEREGVQLEIETLGAEGLRYRSRMPATKTKEWQSLPAFPVKALKDAAGSGDWCTAGLLNKLARNGLEGLRQANREKLHAAFRFGQALAAWNCSFEGARGGMYETDKQTFLRQVEMILAGDEAKSSITEKVSIAANHVIAGLCPSCPEVNFAHHSNRRNGTAG
jgi:sugar/nucleoside kinase (ribokinase family)